MGLDKGKALARTSRANGKKDQEHAQGQQRRTHAGAPYTQVPVGPLVHE